MMDIILAIFLGTLFGFVLHRVGASNPNNIINMLRFKDLHLMKAILLGIACSSSLLFIGMTAGIIDPGHLSVKTSYWGVILGGAILGIGFAIAGYCPGTGIVAVGDGRKDAVVFVAGGLAGAFIFMIMYPVIKNTFLLQKIAGGKVTLADVANPSYDALIGSIPGILIALGIAVAFFLIAWKLPEKAN